jgi:hypothetical protein
LVVLWFELRTSHLLGRCSTTQATAPALFFFFLIDLTDKFLQNNSRNNMFNYVFLHVYTYICVCICLCLCMLVHK